jgi:hypothetical protein
MDAILHRDKPPAEAIHELMTRSAEARDSLAVSYQLSASASGYQLLASTFCPSVAPQWCPIGDASMAVHLYCLQRFRIHPEALPREFYWHFGNRQWPSVLTL